MGTDHRGNPINKNNPAKTNAERSGIGSSPPPPKAKLARPGPPSKQNIPTQEDKDNKNLKMKADELRMKGDKFRGEGGHRSADTQYRQADEIESRMASGSKQLDAKAMSDIRPSAHLKDRDGGGYGARLGDNY